MLFYWSHYIYIRSRIVDCFITWSYLCMNVYSGVLNISTIEGDISVIVLHFLFVVLLKTLTVFSCFCGWKRNKSGNPFLFKSFQRLISCWMCRTNKTRLLFSKRFFVITFLIWFTFLTLEKKFLASI